MVGIAKGLFFGGSETIESTSESHSDPSFHAFLRQRHGCSACSVIVRAQLMHVTGRDSSTVNGPQHGNEYYEGLDADDEYGRHQGKRNLSTTSAYGQFTNSVRVPGGKAAVSKCVALDYDSDDDRIITLKQQGFTDEYVAAKLVEEGRMRYVPKTIGSRYNRLRKTIEEAEEEKLDDELSDWHVDEVSPMCRIARFFR